MREREAGVFLGKLQREVGQEVPGGLRLLNNLKPF
jgi:hypothetical protein